jgi:integrase/recombinase XerD
MTNLTTTQPCHEFAAILKRCEGAYAQNTLRGYASDLEVFDAWCERAGRDALPASTETIAAFVDSQIEHVTPSTLKRRLAAIKFAHRYRDFPDPTKASDVLLAVRRATRERRVGPAKPRD